MKFLALAIR